jgi:hypothetical protein
MISLCIDRLERLAGIGRICLRMIRLCIERLERLAGISYIS